MQLKLRQWLRTLQHHTTELQKKSGGATRKDQVLENALHSMHHLINKAKQNQEGILLVSILKMNTEKMIKMTIDATSAGSRKLAQPQTREGSSSNFLLSISFK